MKKIQLKKNKLMGNIIIFTLLLLTYTFNLLSYPENKLQDKLYQKATAPAPDIILIEIDDKSFDMFGSYHTWGRQIMADAINLLNSGEGKPAVITIDIMYLDESNNPQADTNLTQAVADGGNVVMASQLYIGSDINLQNVILNHRTPYNSLEQHATYGFANAIVDTDGIIRHTLLKDKYQDETVYSMAYETYRMFTGEESEYVANHDKAYIPYYGNPDSYSWGISFADLFEEDFDPDFFEDCIVMIGACAPGLLDSYYTSINPSKQMYGVEIQANIVQMLIEDNFKEYISPQIGFIIILLITIIAIILSELLDIRISLFAFIIMGIGYYFIALHFYNKGYILTLIYPAIALVSIYTYQLIYGYVLESKEKQRVKSIFQKYTDPKLVDKLLESGEATSDQVGVKKDIAVLFVDVRGFTPMTEALRDEPEMVVKILNEYLELTSSAVFANGGSVDKFIGDATMALFNGFVPLDDYVYKAVKSAWNIVQGAKAVNHSIKEKYGIDIGFGVGVNCGNAIVGNLGPSFRKDYTAIGDVVNTAARLESNARASEVLISEYVYEHIKDRIEAKSIGEISLKGKNIKVEVFSVQGMK